MNYSELHDEKLEEMKEKYHDAIYNLAEKYEVPVGEGFDRLKSIAEVALHPNDPNYPALYQTDIELNMEELLKDYLELKAYSDECATIRGLK